MDRGFGDREDGRCSCGRLLEMLEVHVTPTTGGQFQLRVAASDSVEYLRRLVSKRLRVAKERICLLYRERHLRVGSLEENSIGDGARITLLPSVETGLLAQRPEQSVMQALESLNDGQVHDFLTGKAPLNLTMRLGDHMMLIQLQLSTVSPTSSRKSSSRLASTAGGGSSSSSSPHHEHHHHHHHHHHHYHSHSSVSCGGKGSSSMAYNSFGSPSPPHHNSSNASSSSSSASPPSSPLHHHVSSPTPLFTTPPPHHHHHVHHHHHPFHHQRSSTPTSVSSYPTSSSSSPTSPPCLTLDGDAPIRGCPHQSISDDPKASLDTKALAEAPRTLTQTLKQLSSEVLTTKPEKEAPRPAQQRSKTPDRPMASSSSVPMANSNSGSGSSSSSSNAKRQGAIIESMRHHGKGVYSGTFSGTLNPSLQDRQGRPKRDISTIIHILNDLLCATPQYRRHSSSATSSSVASTSSAQTAAAAVNSSSSQNVYGVSTRIGTTKSNGEEEMSLDDNLVTRNKMENLRVIMEERRARRKARREARSSPYAHPSTSWSSETTTTMMASQAIGGPLSEAAAAAGQSIEVDEKDDAASLCELNSGTVVA